MTICPKYADMRSRFAAPGASLDADGFPVWPGPRVTLPAKAGSFDNIGFASLLRANGFASTWTATTAGAHVWNSTQIGAIGPLIAGTVPGGDALFPLTVTINGGAADLTPGGDRYVWYLSQRSDNTRLPLPSGGLSPTGQPQYFTISHPPDRLHSGTVIISVNPFVLINLFPLSAGIAPTDAASLATLFNDCALYVSRVSDNAYQWARFVSP